MSFRPWMLLAGAGLAAVAGCATQRDALGEQRPAALDLGELAAAEPRATERVGGDLEARAERIEAAGEAGADVWRWGSCRVTTALPIGYPAPTPPGALEIKHYPRARRAEVGGNSNPDMGMFFAFWPLFRHIQRQGIAMTSPVEMDYAGVGDDGRLDWTGWTMSFLYREPEMGATGTAGSVEVVDRAPVTVLSLGVKGPYGWTRSNEGTRKLRE